MQLKLAHVFRFAILFIPAKEVFQGDKLGRNIMSALTITHTSPVEIKEIDERGGCAGNGSLFFSLNDYAMGDVNFTYDLELDESEVISARELHDDEIIERIADYFCCGLELAESLLDASESEWNQEFECEGDDSWWLQGLRAECANKMGYTACEDEDENGAVYIVKMNGDLLSKMVARA